MRLFSDLGPEVYPFAPQLTHDIHIWQWGAHSLAIKGGSTRLPVSDFWCSFCSFSCPLAMAVRIVAHRRLAFIVFTIVFLFMLHSILTTTSVINGLVYFPSFIPFTRQEQHPFSDQITNHEAEAFCTPEQYSEGYWSRRPELLLRPLIKPDDVYPISGFQGCASSREVGWHLAKSWGEDEEQRSRPWRGNASAYDWIPGRECGGYTKPTQEELVIQLVERGGWLILGGTSLDNCSPYLLFRSG